MLPSEAVRWFEMSSSAPLCRLLLLLLLGQAGVWAEVSISGRVVDETDAAIAGALVEVSTAEGVAVATASSDLAGNFQLTLPAPGAYEVRARRLGFYLYQGHAQRFEKSGELTITLNHLQEFSEKVDVVYSPPAIDPAQPSDHRELDNAEILTVPYPAQEDYRNALPMMDGVVLDNAGPAPLQRRAGKPDQLLAGRLQHFRPGDGAAGSARELSKAFSPWTWRPAASRPETGAARRACWT